MSNSIDYDKAKQICFCCGSEGVNPIYNDNIAVAYVCDSLTCYNYWVIEVIPPDEWEEWFI